MTRGPKSGAVDSFFSILFLLLELPFLASMIEQFLFPPERVTSGSWVGPGWVCGQCGQYQKESCVLILAYFRESSPKSGVSLAEVNITKSNG